MLNVLPIDKDTNTEIESDSEIIIMVTDTLQVIKEKIFLMDMRYYPNFIKIEIKVDDNYIILSDKLIILDNKIYISNIITELEKENEKTQIFYPDILYESLINDNFSDLTREEFDIAVNFIKNPEENAFIEFLDKYLDPLKKKYQMTDKDIEFYDLCKKDRYNDNLISDKIYKDINVIIKGNDIDFSIKTNNVFIKLLDIFNIIELNSNIPFIGLNKKFTNDTSVEPLLKVYDGILEDISEKEIKSWILNEKKMLNQTTYKTIRGLMMKIKLDYDNYLTMNIMPNGLIYVKYSSKDNESIDNIMQVIKTNVNDTINILNKLNVFYKSRRINSVENSSLEIESLDIISTTNFYISRRKLKHLLKEQDFNLLEYKDTNSADILSLYFLDNINDKKLTLNIKDSLTEKDSSIINIFNVKNVKLYKIIIEILYIIHLISDKINEYDEDRKIVEKSSKKILKDAGINFNSRKCQHHPILIDNVAKGDSEIQFNNRNYKCNDKMYGYPGFTIDNILCCFTKSQIGNETYIRNINPDSYDILIKPSNFKIKINGDFETYAIKMISNYENDMNLSKYFYVNRNNILQPILNDELINAIELKENSENIWFDTITLAQLIYPSPTNKCSNKPNLNQRYNLNAPCAEPENEFARHFGYGASGIPCCFNTERDDTIVKKKKESDITNTYILKPNKPLKNMQIGELSKNLDELFNKVLEHNYHHYRIGVLQNNNSFLNGVLLAVKDDFKLNGIIDFKGLVNKYLDNNPEEFLKLNNGLVYLKYKTVDNYKKYLNNNKNYIYYNDFIDLLEKVFNINIILMEEVLDNKNKYNITMICRSNKKYSNVLSNLVLLKTRYDENSLNTYIKNVDSFELLIRINEKSSSKDKIIILFSQRSNTIKFLLEFYSKTCIQINVYPENFCYIPLLSYNSLNMDIKYQIVNSLNKVSMVMIDDGYLIPIIETSIIDNIPKIIFTELVKDDSKLLSLEKYIKFVKDPKVKQKINMKLLGLLPAHNRNIGGIMTNFGYIIPYNKRNTLDLSLLPELDFVYYLKDIDSIVSKTKNPYNDFIEYKDNVNKNLQLMKIKISDVIVSLQDIKLLIENLVKDKNATRSEQIKDLLKIFNNIFNNKYINDSYYQFIFNIIANEIINDNVENLLINGIVTSSNVIENHDNESILLNVDDIYTWIKNHKN